MDNALFVGLSRQIVLRREMDIVANNTDSGQLAKYQDVFPGFWEHDAVKGITLWGYIEGQTWVNNTHLVRRDGSERPAMAWLKNYVRTTTIGGGSGLLSSIVCWVVFRKNAAIW